jgi:hypothetical protein
MEYEHNPDGHCIEYRFKGRSFATQQEAEQEAERWLATPGPIYWSKLFVVIVDRDGNDIARATLAEYRRLPDGNRNNRIGTRIPAKR